MLILFYKFVFQYLTTIKLSSVYAFNYIVLRLLPWNILETNNFTIQHVVYCCCHRNYYNCFFKLIFVVFEDVPCWLIFRKVFINIWNSGRILSFVNLSLLICILKSLAHRWTYSIGRLNRPHFLNISETAGSTQTQFHIKPLRHLGNKRL